MVYFIQNEQTGLVKIGHSSNPWQRLGELQTASPVPLRLIGVIPGGKAEEAYLHKRYQRQRRGGEWFEVTHKMVHELVEQEWYVATRERQERLSLKAPAPDPVQTPVPPMPETFTVLVSMAEAYTFTVLVKEERRAA